MLTLGNLTLFLLLCAGLAWLWHGHGLRERALAAVIRHCEREGVELLDGNVAFGRYRFARDARGRRRFARVYGFEFTVTGEQRHQGSITLFGAQVGRIELAPHPCTERPAEALSQDDARRGEVVRLEDWRRSRD